MKTIAVQIENYDEIVSIKDKLSWFPRQRVILVWPKRGSVVKSELDLVLLQREANSLGSDLALVTHHPMVKEWAESQHMPVFASIPTAEKADRKPSTLEHKIEKTPMGLKSVIQKKGKIPERPKSKSTGTFQKSLAIVLSLAALIALLMVIIPRAEITYYPEIVPQGIEINIKASQVYSGFNPSGSIPASMKYVEVSGELSSPSSGKTTLPASKATGTVIFNNLTSSPVTIPAGTILLTKTSNGVQFILQEDVKLNGGTGNSGEGKVEAAQPGSQGNLATGEIASVVGESGALVSVTNSNPFTGGSDLETSSPNDSDYATLQGQLLENLKKQSLTSFEGSLENGTKLIEESLGVDKILQQEQVNKVGEPADVAVLRMTVRMQALTYQENDLVSIASLLLNSNQPAGFSPLNAEINIQQIDKTSLDDLDQATWTINASRILIPNLDAELAAQKLAGMKISEAKQVISTLFPHSQPARIKLIFSWWLWMPFLPTQIHFVDGAAS